MGSSFFEYRDTSGMESDSDTEIIDNSVLDESFVPKTPGKKNQTAFVPESDDSVTEGDSFGPLLNNHLNYLAFCFVYYKIT